MLDRLVSSAYSAFDKNPHAQIVLRITHPDGVAWTVADRTLTLATEAGAALGVIALRDRTMLEVSSLIAETGCRVVYLNLDMAQRAADSLLPGGARQSDSNGDALRAYDSLLWSVLDAYAVVLEDAEQDMLLALQQLYLGSASDELLDVWGDYFGLPRIAGEDNQDYRLRIIRETLRPRGNALAIEDAIKSVTGHTVEIYEPWRNRFVLGKSALDGDDHIEDGTYWTHNVIQPVTTEHVRWDDIMRVVEQSRAAGVIVAPPRFDARMFADASIQQQVEAGQEQIRSMQAFNDVNGRLDVMGLGNDEPQVVNWKTSMAQLITVHNTQGLSDPGPIDAGRRDIRRANVVLSDGDPIGAINSVFQRSYWIQPPDDMTLGVSRLSDYDGLIYLGMVNEISDLYAGHVSFSDFSGAKVALACSDVRPFGPIPANLNVVSAGVGIESIHAEVAPLGQSLALDMYLWGFSGAGTWSQDETTVWQDGTPWNGGDVAPQS